MIRTEFNNLKLIAFSDQISDVHFVKILKFFKLKSLQAHRTLITTYYRNEYLRIQHYLTLENNSKHVSYWFFFLNIVM